MKASNVTMQEGQSAFRRHLIGPSLLHDHVVVKYITTTLCFPSFHTKSIHASVFGEGRVILPERLLN